MKSDVKQWFTNTTTGNNKHISLTPLKPTGKKICQSKKPLEQKKKNSNNGLVVAVCYIFD